MHKNQIWFEKISYENIFSHHVKHIKQLKYFFEEKFNESEFLCYHMLRKFYDTSQSMKIIPVIIRINATKYILLFL